MSKAPQLLIFTTILTAGFYSSPWLTIARAESCADVYLIQNLLYANQRSQELEDFEEAELGRRINPEDEVYAGQSSIGALLFNDRSLVRISGKSTNDRAPFSFESDESIEEIIAGTGSFIKTYLTLADGGQALIMVPDGLKGSFIVKTNQGLIEVSTKSSDNQAALPPEQNIPAVPQVVCDRTADLGPSIFQEPDSNIEQREFRITSEPPEDLGLESAPPTSPQPLEATSEPAPPTAPEPSVPESTPQPLEAELEAISQAEESGQITAFYVQEIENTTEIYALTGDEEILVSNLENGSLPNQNEQVPLLGGQAVQINRSQISDPQEFNIGDFLSENPLAYGLPIDQSETAVPTGSRVSTELQTFALSTIISTKRSIQLAIDSQSKRLRGFRATFLKDALNGTLSRYDFNGQQDEESNGNVIGVEIPGTYTWVDPPSDDSRTAVFTPTGGATPTHVFVIDFDAETLTITNLETGQNTQNAISATGTINAGIASGTATLEDATAINGRIFGVPNEDPQTSVPQGTTFEGTLTEGLAPDF